MSTPMTPQKTLDYIKKSGELISAAEKRAAETMKKEAAVQSLIPGVVDAMISNGRIPEELRAKAAEQLRDHNKTLEILASVSAHRTDAELGHIGTPVKTASSKESPYVGVRTSAERQSDIEFLERFGIRR